MTQVNEVSTAVELSGLKAFLAPALPVDAKTIFNNWPKEPVAKTLVVRSMPDERRIIATGIIQTIRQYQVLYVDTRIDVVKAVTDAMKSKLAEFPDIPLDPGSLLVGRIDAVTGGQPFKTEQSSPLDGDFFTLRMTTYTAQSRESYETISGVSFGNAIDIGGGAANV